MRDVYELKEWTTHHDRVFENVPQLVKKKYDTTNNISIVCPPNSMRNPSGHFNHYTQHVIQNGSLYHIIVPLLSEAQKNGSVRAFHVNQSGMYDVTASAPIINSYHRKCNGRTESDSC